MLNEDYNMSIVFATCERKRALGFLQKLYPSSIVTDTDNSVKDILDLVEADEMRICDPDFHGGSILFGNNKKPDTEERMYAALEKSGLWFKRT